MLDAETRDFGVGSAEATGRGERPPILVLTLDRSAEGSRHIAGHFVVAGGALVVARKLEMLAEAMGVLLEPLGEDLSIASATRL